MRRKKMLLMLLLIVALLMGFAACNSEEEDDDTVTYVPLSQITAIASSVGWELEAENIVDGNPDTYWHSMSLPESIEEYGIDSHFATLDLGGTYNVTRLVYHGRMDQWTNSTITRYAIYTSTNADGPFTRVASGEWSGVHQATEYANFDPVEARFIRLVALEATAMDDDVATVASADNNPDIFFAGIGMMRIGVLGQPDFDENYR